MVDPDSFKLGNASTLLRLGIVVLILAVTYLLYMPGFSGPFLLDDFSTLMALESLGGVTDLDSFRQFVFGNTSGPTGRPVSMVSFLLDGDTWPGDAAGYKQTNVFLHLTTGILLGWFLLLLFRCFSFSESRSAPFALVAMILWLAHPFNVSTTLYIVQRMTQLMVLFSMAALICYLYGRTLIVERPGRGMLLLAACLFPFGLLAVLSKENGVLLLVSILLLEYTCFYGHKKCGLLKWWLRLGVYLPLSIVGLYLLLNFQSMTADYVFRPFTLAERLMTEARILWVYLSNIFLPRAGSVSLFHDDFSISTGLFSPFTTLVAVSGLLGLVVIAFLQRRRQPVLCFAIFWFLLWHLMESTYLPLEPYFEHRNYVAMIGPLAALTFYGGRLISIFDTRRLTLVSRLVVLCVFVYSAGATLGLTTLWGDTVALYSHWANNQPGSIRANTSYSDVLAAMGDTENGYEYLYNAYELAPDEITLKLSVWNYACEHGLTPAVELSDIGSAESLQHYRDDINYPVRVLLENLLAGKCQYPPREEVLALMERLDNIPLRPYDRANFHMLYADFFIYYRQLTPALVQLRNAYNIRGDAAIPIRQAILAASAGNLEDSLAFLDRAREADSNRNPLLPSRIDEIGRMERDIKQRLGI